MLMTATARKVRKVQEFSYIKLYKTFLFLNRLFIGNTQDTLVRGIGCYQH